MRSPTLAGQEPLAGCAAVNGGSLCRTRSLSGGLPVPRPPDPAPGAAVAPAPSDGRADLLLGSGPVLPAPHVGALTGLKLLIDLEEVADLGELLVRNVREVLGV